MKTNSFFNVQSIQEFWDWLSEKNIKSGIKRIYVVFSPFTYLIFRKISDFVMYRKYSLDLNNPFERFVVVLSLTFFVAYVIYYKFIRNSKYINGGALNSTLIKYASDTQNAVNASDDVKKAGVEIAFLSLFSLLAFVIFMGDVVFNVVGKKMNTLPSTDVSQNVQKYEKVETNAFKVDQTPPATNIPAKAVARDCRKAVFSDGPSTPLVVKAFERAKYGECAKRGVINRQSFCQADENSLVCNGSKRV